MTILSIQPQQSAIDTAMLFDLCITATTSGLSPSSRPIYTHTYRLWQAFAKVNGFGFFDFTSDRIEAFIKSRDISRAGKQCHLTHFRRFIAVVITRLKTGSALIDQYRRVLESMKFISIPKDPPGENTSRYSRVSLNLEQCNRMLAVWQTDEGELGNSLEAIRNYAILGLLLSTGMRALELTSLRWEDVDLENKIVVIRHSKGGKTRTCAIFDPSGAITAALQKLRDFQPDDPFVFRALSSTKLYLESRGKPCSLQSLRNMLEKSCRLANLGHMSLHDLRRTFVTMHDDAGNKLGDIADQIGHANIETTRIYIVRKSAQKRAERCHQPMLGG